MWRYSAKSRYITFAVSFVLNAALMHWILLRQISQSIYLKDNQQHIEFIYEANNNLTRFDQNLRKVYETELIAWTDWIFTFEY